MRTFADIISERAAFKRMCCAEIRGANLVSRGCLEGCRMRTAWRTGFYDFSLGHSLDMDRAILKWHTVYCTGIPPPKLLRVNFMPTHLQHAVCCCHLAARLGSCLDLQGDHSFRAPTVMTKGSTYSTAGDSSGVGMREYDRLESRGRQIGCSKFKAAAHVRSVRMPRALSPTSTCSHRTAVER